MELQRLYVTLALEADDFKAGMASVTGIVAAAGIAAAAAITVVAVDGVKAARDMEEQMSGIAAIFSTTVDEIEPLGTLIKELGLNPNLKVNATEAADAIEMLGKNGLTMAEILDGAAESTVLLANSTGADFATAANIGTDAMALFKIEAKDMIDAVDGITSVTVNSKFGINDYALALAQGGGVAEMLKAVIEKEVGIKTRFNKLGTNQRSAMHFASLTDVNEAYICGRMAVKAAMDSINGKMITLVREDAAGYKCTTGLAELSDVANGENKVPREYINEQGNGVPQAMLDYVRPLVMGEAPIEIGDDGLPVYMRFDRKPLKQILPR